MKEDAQPQTDSLSPIRALDDSQKEAKVHLAQFFLSLIQAFLRTGYYTPDHPESLKARIGLYESFQKVFHERKEVTFLVRDDTEVTRILIEGALAEPQDLNDLMLQGMAEMYSPKFAKFLERKDLVSLTLKNTMTEEEFTNFVDIMGEPNFDDTREKTDKERFVQTLKDKSVFNISYIFKEDLLATKREIPWRAQVALSRLKKDFKMVPLYHNLDEEGIKNIRKEIIHDIARPVRDPKVLYPILMNSDLAETEEFKEAEIDEVLIGCISGELLLETAKRLGKEALPYGETGPLKRKAVGLAPKVASALNQREVAGRGPVLEDFFKSNLISDEELPEETRLRIKIEQLTDKFLQQSGSYLEQFDKLQDGEKYLKIAQTLTRIIPELVRRDRYEEVLKIITLLERHFTRNDALSVHAHQILEEFKVTDTPGILKAKFLTGNKELCQAIRPIFVKLGKASLPYILSLLRESNDQMVLKGACEILIGVDPTAIKSILDDLSKGEIPPESAIPIMRVLGEIRHGEWTKPLTKTLRGFLNHENPHVREEALWASYKIMGTKAEKLYLRHLSDPDPGVQKMAIQCLGRIKSEVALKKFFETAQKLEEAQTDKNRHLETSIFNAFGFYGNVQWPGLGTLEDFLLETLERQLNVGRLNFFKKKKSRISDAAVAAICETLGKIGTDKSRPILQKLERQQESLWKNKAEDALMKIAERKEGERANQAP